MYLNNSAGQFWIDGEVYLIEQNTAFVFNEGLSHETQNTAAEPRLLLGPMSEAGFAVGASVNYFPTAADALAFTNIIAGIYSYTVGTYGGFSSWRIASNSSGSSSKSVVYKVGDVLNNDGTYNMYPATPCFLEGSKILCQIDGKETYVPIEEIKKGTLVKTSRDGFKRVEVIGKGSINNPGTSERSENRLYKCTPANYPELTEDLVITGCHSILVDKLSDEQREKIIKSAGRIFITDKKYRLMAAVDERAEPWQSEGKYTIWHFALENADDGMNYGVYANGGLLVETCSLRFMLNKSNMTFV